MKSKRNPSYLIQSLCIVLALSFFIFFQFDIKFNAYIGIAISVFVLFSACFFWLKNAEFYCVYLLCALANLFVFLFEKRLEGYMVCFDVQDGFYIAYGALCSFLCLGSVFVCLRGKRRREFENINFFSERRDDLSRLKNYVNDFSVVGLNSFLGEGKTFLLNLFEHTCTDYYYISICVMTVKIDTVENYIINEVNEILERHGILSLASSKLLSLLKNDNFYGLGNLFVKNNSYTQLLQQLCADIQKLDKPILLAFEDIDRIRDTNLIYKIFALTDLLAYENDKIKVLFEYDEAKLLEVLGEKKIYLEKYIPHTLVLTPIPFKRCVKVFLEEGRKHNKYLSLELEDFKCFFLQTSLDYYLAESFGVNKSFSLDIKFSIRKVMFFLDEIDECLKHNAVFRENKKVLIVFMFLKHFEYSDFNDISEDEFYSASKLFKYMNQSYTISELMNYFSESESDKSELFDSVFVNNSKNLNHLIYLHYFGYEFRPVKRIESYNAEERASNLLNEEIENIRIKEHNDKIDRLIRNLLCNGKSEYTNLENAVKELEKVLDNQCAEDRSKAFSNFCRSAFYEEFEKADNKTVFRIGISNFIPLFQGFSLYETNESYWIKLVDFYFDHQKTNSITPEVVQVFNYCDVSKRNVFLYLLDKFNSLDINGNLNDTVCYPKFLKLYLGAFSALGYIDTRLIDVYSFSFSSLEKNRDDYFELYCTFADELRTLKIRAPLPQIKKECDLLKGFMKKNVRLIMSKNPLKEYTVDVKTSIDVNDSLDETLEEIESKNLSGQGLYDYLDDKYKSGSLSAYEVKRVIEKYFPLQ